MHRILLATIGSLVFAACATEEPASEVTTDDTVITGDEAASLVARLSAEGYEPSDAVPPPPELIADTAELAACTWYIISGCVSWSQSGGCSQYTTCSVFDCGSAAKSSYQCLDI